MKIKAIVKKMIKYNPNGEDRASGGYRVWLDFGEIYNTEALALFNLQGSDIVLNVEITNEARTKHNG
jgi:hypothetical protein